MPTFQFEAMDSTGQEIKDVIEAPTEAEAQATIRQMGYFVTRISVKKERKKKSEKTAKKKRGLAIGGDGHQHRSRIRPHPSLLPEDALAHTRNIPDIQRGHTQ